MKELRVAATLAAENQTKGVFDVCPHIGLRIG